MSSLFLEPTLYNLHNKFELFMSKGVRKSVRFKRTDVCAIDCTNVNFYSLLLDFINSSCRLHNYTVLFFNTSNKNRNLLL